MIFNQRGIALPAPLPLIDGAVPAHGAVSVTPDRTIWPLATGGRLVLETVEADGRLGLTVWMEGASRSPLSLGLRFIAIGGVQRYLRNGYQSWDGSYFVEPGTPAGDGPPAKAPTLGYAMTALVGEGGVAMLGFDRHDRFQTRFGFAGSADALDIDVETLLDRTGETRGETLWLSDGDAVEPALRAWSDRVAAASPLPARIPADRITGWCSWYNLYAAIDEPVILEHLAAARGFRDARAVPLDVFQIDDGFTPEMGDWLAVKPQFPRGMAPLVADVAAAGFRPGLWIAPFLVGNRSRLFADHPDWVVQDVATDGPLVAMHFYGEFRWHKRSEEYYVLDVTHPDAEAYLRDVFRTWAHEWGVRYFKCDFLLHGAEYGPDRARWYVPGRSRIAIWRMMMTLIREEVGDDAIVVGCGSPLWASVGLVDAVRIARDVGVTWHGEYSAESLLRDQQARNHAHGILWQADPDCVLLRDRFHNLSADEVEALARFAAGSGGVLMTSDRLDVLSEDRATLFAKLLRSDVTACDFPELGRASAVAVQRVRSGDRVVAVQRLNPTDAALSVDGIEVGPHMMAIEPAA